MRGYEGQHVNGRTRRLRRFGGYRVVNLVLRLRGPRLGWTSDVVGREECPYLRRHILWLGFLTLRLHKFLRSDNDQALHDHPWWFVTFPLRTYRELVPSGRCGCGGRIEDWKDGGCCHSYQDVPELRTVAGWRPHFRRAEHCHAVVVDRPTWTLVLGGWKSRDWGFWEPGVGFVPFWRWFNEKPLPPCADPQEAT